jgi:subtilisin family serine protease
MNQYSSLPKYDPNSQNPLQMDLRSTDLSELDLSQSRDDLMYAIFDSKTTWPENMPADFDWQAIMETGKNPGLGVRSLHERGITGKGVGIAIIDQPLLVEHQEYATQLRLYEEINIQPGTESQMHGPAVASIAVGKTVGVAPGADLYYIASWAFDNSGDNFTYKAQAIRRIIEINTQLPSDRKIRVISISVGWQKDQTGYNEITDAVNEAKAAGIFVISSSIEKIYGLKFHGLGRNPLANPDDVSSYLPGSWWAKDFYAGKYGEPRLLVPMDSRTTASPNGNEDYVFYREGGWSWSIPYLAGMYALAAQVDPAITPDKFWKLAMETGQTIEILHEGQSYQLGPILDPAALIAALKH